MEKKINTHIEIIFMGVKVSEKALIGKLHGSILVWKWSTQVVSVLV